jgi:hypothetical protein
MQIAEMETRKIINDVIRSVGDFNLLRMDKQWSGTITSALKAKFNRLKLEYKRSRTDQQCLRSDDNFNTLRTGF